MAKVLRTAHSGTATARPKSGGKRHGEFSEDVVGPYCPFPVYTHEYRPT